MAEHKPQNKILKKCSKYIMVYFFLTNYTAKKRGMAHHLLPPKSTRDV